MTYDNFEKKESALALSFLIVYNF